MTTNFYRLQQSDEINYSTLIVLSQKWSTFYIEDPLKSMAWTNKEAANKSVLKLNISDVEAIYQKSKADGTLLLLSNQYLEYLISNYPTLVIQVKLVQMLLAWKTYYYQVFKKLEMAHDASTQARQRTILTNIYQKSKSLFFQAESKMIDFNTLVDGISAILEENGWKNPIKRRR